MLLIEAGLLYWGIFISLVGMAFFMYGKKRPDPAALIAGIVLMIYPYFIRSLWVSIGIGVGMIALYFFLRKIVQL